MFLKLPSICGYILPIITLRPLHNRDVMNKWRKCRGGLWAESCTPELARWQEERSHSQSSSQLTVPGLQSGPFWGINMLKHQSYKLHSSSHVLSSPKQSGGFEEISGGCNSFISLLVWAGSKPSHLRHAVFKITCPSSYNTVWQQT